MSRRRSSCFKRYFQFPRHPSEFTERYILLSSIDRLWQEHLYAMDSLKTSIGLRAHGQKDPVIEYKQEAYTMFEELMSNIRRDILNNLFRSMSSLSAFESFLKNLPQNMVKDHFPGMEEAARQQAGPSLAEQAGEPAKPEEDLHLPIKRSQEKIGRNERVIIKRGGETQTVKYKKAEPMLASGWILVEKESENGDD